MNPEIVVCCQSMEEVAQASLHVRNRVRTVPVELVQLRKRQDGFGQIPMPCQRQERLLPAPQKRALAVFDQQNGIGAIEVIKMSCGQLPAFSHVMPDAFAINHHELSIREPRGTQVPAYPGAFDEG